MASLPAKLTLEPKLGELVTTSGMVAGSTGVGSMVE